ncbi:ABC transporter substrate-binding protein [Maritimibacter sp. DP1N21-5]|uniref:ABC transporter substrate-binding protein n=1 Tax=Maritimibacter sp. DP1N21-5 TaxID=2836867 RepID=UPI001C45BC6D|nr:ABC transporter substrate-binding protein [Maritimibacter sp. DP1N21-5]MBV7409218.1 ABC transporter substrate-binding protein [Maritimibacter sp. DP1N21-5]
MKQTRRIIHAAFLAATVPLAASAADLVVPVAYLRLEEPPRAVLSNLDAVPEDLGLAGADLGRADNATTGSFMGHDYQLTTVSLPPEGDVVAAARELAAGHRIILADMHAERLLAVADLPELEGALIFNVSSEAPRLRSEDCRANVFHTATEASMRADALMQVLLAKRWTTLALIEGETDDDRALAETYRASARKFGLKIVSEAEWSEAGDLRRFASREVPLLTQGFKDHDAVLVADAGDDFARYIEHNTFEPRPVAGATGLMPLAWAPVVEQWGAAQLQNRFEALAGRDMAPRDYAAWAAMRVVGEAVTRTNSADPGALRDYILADDFELAGFQGRPLSFRQWNGQMRQPIPVVNARALVESAPLDGFEHQFNPLDSLGMDRPESTCTAFGD